MIPSWLLKPYLHGCVNVAKKTFSNRLWISTTDRWGANAEEAIQNQNPPVSRIGLKDLEISPVDWDKLLEGVEGRPARLEGKRPMAHQLKAISEAYIHYLDHDRGKLIMACGTGKTYTSLKIAETILQGEVSPKVWTKNFGAYFMCKKHDCSGKMLLFFLKL